MRIDVTYTDTVVTFVLKFSDEDLTLSKEEEFDAIQKWVQMLRTCLKVIDVGIYPIYKFDSCLLYLFGWVDHYGFDNIFQDPEDYVRQTLSIAKQKKNDKSSNEID